MSTWILRYLLLMFFGMMMIGFHFWTIRREQEHRLNPWLSLLLYVSVGAPCMLFLLYQEPAYGTATYQLWAVSVFTVFFFAPDVTRKLAKKRS